MAKNRKRKSKIRFIPQYYDYSLLVAILFLLAFGLVILYSTSAYESRINFGDSSFYFDRQFLYTCIGLASMLLVARFDYHIYLRFAKVAYVVSLILCLLVRFSPLGVTLNGSRRWLGYGNFSFQPAELAKIALIIFIAFLVVQYGSLVKQFEYTFVMLCYTLVLGLAVYWLTDNLSSGLLIIAIGMIMSFISSPNYKWFAIGAGVVLLFIIVYVFFLTTFGEITDTTSFRKIRIIVWRDPISYSDSYGYQTLQGLYAIGSGGLFGKGLGNSIQKNGYIPEAQNDMIFSIVCEELGLFGAICLIFLFGFLIWRLYLIASNAPDLFGSMIAIGIMAHVAVQVIFNIAVVTNVLPNTGVTLPFISYGGTSVIILLAEMGIGLNISSKIRKKKEETEEAL
ncbi:MAG: putative lipid II flippase FtsW [Lachnospiraceae bacterium]|nr:putative lipid II flippase FtsW [Lachnospiraceae bacterium]